MGIFYYILGVIGSVATIIIAADLEVHTRYIAGIMSKLGTITLGILVMHECIVSCVDRHNIEDVLYRYRVLEEKYTIFYEFIGDYYFAYCVSDQINI